MLPTIIDVPSAAAAAVVAPPVGVVALGLALPGMATAAEELLLLFPALPGRLLLPEVGAVVVPVVVALLNDDVWLVHDAVELDDDRADDCSGANGAAAARAAANAAAAAAAAAVAAAAVGVLTAELVALVIAASLLVLSAAVLIVTGPAVTAAVLLPSASWVRLDDDFDSNLHKRHVLSFDPAQIHVVQ